MILAILQYFFKNAVTQNYNHLGRVLHFVQFKQRLINYFIGLLGSLHVF